MTILAFDLGKFNSVACIFNAASGISGGISGDASGGGGGGGHRFQSLATSPQAVHDLLVEIQPRRVVFETCSIAGWVHDLCVTLDVPEIQVANPSGEAWKWKNVKRKTDKDDALKLATMSAMGTLPLVWMPTAGGRQLRRLILHRSQVVARCTAMKNQVHAILQQQALPLAAGKSSWTAAGLTRLDELARPIQDCDVEELWRGRLHVELAALRMMMKLLSQMEQKLDALGKADEKIARLRTVPGVGPRLAETVAAFVGDPHRFKSAREISAYAGLVPRQYQSGTMERHGRITRRGPRLLRSMLVEVSWLAVRHNDWARSVVDHVSKGVKGRRRQAVVALARKLLVRLWAMLRDGTDWRDPTPAAASGQEASGKEAKTPPEGLAGLLPGPTPAV